MHDLLRDCMIGMNESTVLFCPEYALFIVRMTELSFLCFLTVS